MGGPVQHSIAQQGIARHLRLALVSTVRSQGKQMIWTNYPALQLTAADAQAAARRLVVFLFGHEHALLLQVNGTSTY